MADTNTVIGNVASVNKGEISSLFSQVKKWTLIVAGTICVCLGVAGIFLPLLPTTPFLLLAAVCYAGSSPRFYHWLMNNRWFGRYIKNYREGKGLTLNDEDRVPGIVMDHDRVLGYHRCSLACCKARAVRDSTWSNGPHTAEAHL